jgi:RNA polymerase sigma-70 factor (ECF subfamily)
MYGVIAVRGTSHADLEARFMVVYTQEGPPIFRYLRARSNDSAEAEDLHAETFCRAWQAWPRFRGETSDVRPWLFRIARNLLVDRHRRRRLLWFLPLENYEASAVKDDIATGVSNRTLLEKALRQLSSPDRELVAFRLAGLSHREIGRIQGRSELAVKMAWHRAIERLRAHMAEGRYGP